MIRVTVEIFPGGDVSRGREMAEIEIWNETHTTPWAYYVWEAKIAKVEGEGVTHHKGDVRHTIAMGWARLVELVLEDMQRERAVVALCSETAGGKP